MRSLFLCLLLWSLPAFAQVADPILAIPITKEFLNDVVIRGYFADVLRAGGFGHWKTERAAFLVRDEDGQYRCIAWPLDGRLQQQEFRGAIPERTVAIIHTHPAELPLGSTGDARTAIKLSVPIFVLTPLNIYMITARGASVPVVENKQWATSSASSSTRCSAPDERASPSRADIQIHVAPAKILVQDAKELRTICRVERSVAGCTFFASEKLDCGCERQRAIWKLTARASFDPVIYLSDYSGQYRGSPLRMHETMHIEDVTSRLRAYLRELVAQQFDSEEQCLQQAAAAADPQAFVRLMNEFRYQSNVKFQCVKPGAHDIQPAVSDRLAKDTVHAK